MNISPTLLAKFAPPECPGSFMISFEGVEGCGKSTQIELAKNFLEERQFKAILMREPGGTKFGEKLRGAILESKQPLDPVAQMHLFASSRAQLLFEIALPALKNSGTVVMYDRYIDSSLAYQASAGEIGIESVLTSHQDFPLTTLPHLTFYLKIDAATSRARQEVRGKNKDYFESQGDDFYHKLVEGYDQAAKLFPERFVVIDGTQEQKVVFSHIKEKLQELIEQKNS